MLSSSEHKIVELKARVDTLDLIREKLNTLRAHKIGAFHQTDIYFDVPDGRLKLRKTEDQNEAELVYYERENVAKIKESSAFILKIQNPDQFESVLKQILCTKAVVEKLREIYFVQGTQIHLDTVQCLGNFVEFEKRTSRIPKAQRDGRNVLKKLALDLGINTKNLEKLSYSDLIGQPEIAKHNFQTAEK